MLFGGLFPFGNGTILFSDSGGQYTQFFAYLKSIVFDNNDAFYSFSIGLGGNAFGLVAYYLLSPLNVIYLLFPEHLLPVTFLLVTLIKIGLCGLTAYIFFSHKTKLSFKTLLFSTSYALCGFVVSFYFNSLWLDGVILLPIIALGIDKIISDQKAYLFLFSLALAIFSNYYIGFMLCVFSVLYLIYRLIIVKPKNIIQPISRFLVAASATALLNAVILLPGLAALKDSKSVTDLSSLTFSSNFSLLDIFTKFNSGSTDMDQMINGLPNIFVGMVILFLAILFFFNRKFVLRQKVATAILLGIFLISFHISAFNLIWHGTVTPIWFSYRFSFIFSFILIYLAHQCFVNIAGVEKKHILHTAVIFIVSMIIIHRNLYTHINLMLVYFDILLFLTACYLLYSIKSHSDHLKYIIYLVFIQILSLTANLSITVDRYISAGMPAYSSVYSEDTAVEGLLSTIDDTDFFRITSSISSSQNDAIRHQYNGFSHYSSTFDKSSSLALSERLGFGNNGQFPSWLSFGSTISAESLLGLRYIIATNTPKPYPVAEQNNNSPFVLFYNQRALPIGFVVDDINVESHSNIFAYQNQVFTNLSGIGEDIFTPLKVDMELDNVQQVEQPANGSLSFERISPSLDASITYTTKIDRDQPVYFHSPSIWEDIVVITANGRTLPEATLDDGALAEFTWESYPVSFLGQFKAGETLTIKIELKEDKLTLTPNIYYENLDVLDKHLDKLKTNPCDLNKITSSHLTCTVSVSSDNQYLFFSIPFDTNWKILIDGEESRPEKAMNDFLSTKISAGEHHIELKYTPYGFKLGSTITIVTIIGLVIFIYSDRRGLRKKKL